jgi:DNA invertase Pin-like site-specific DNA recombinase
MGKINCAIYCRKSTEKGLDQEFNSLDNQEFACKNYILSQTFQGWEHYKTYSDGGISGGTMSRPSLQEMLTDIRAGKIQMVLVYKIDRLSRSIYDFKRMMKEDFEKHGCNLVSITQSFDTSNAMGKLTLNMLLSFAEFEREVASERVRDKMRATKSQGMWVGGTMPLGYDVVDKKLIPNEVEANTVREIFETYLSCASIHQLAEILVTRGIKCKEWTTKKGEVRGGSLISKSVVHRILTNPLYIGKMPNRSTNEVFNGNHEPIIDKELFDKVQAKLYANNAHGDAPYRRGEALLHNKIMTAKGKVFKNHVGNKGEKRYRYYKADKIMLPAGDMENIVRDMVREFLDSDMTGMPGEKRMAFKQVAFTDALVKPMIDKIVYNGQKLMMFINFEDVSYLADFKGNEINPTNESLKQFYIINDNKHVIIEKQIFVNQMGTRSNRYIGRGTAILTKSENATNLIRALAHGWRFRKLYEIGKGVKELEKQEKMTHRTIYKYLALGYLSPKIISAIMDSNIPGHINLQTLFGLAAKYEDFERQERTFFEA